jgi:hypothetical protein
MPRKRGHFKKEANLAMEARNEETELFHPDDSPECVAA